MKLPLVKLSTNIIKPYIRGLHLGSYTYLFSNILDHTISRDDTLELIKKNPKLYIESTVSNFINLLGIESPGLTSSLAIGEYVSKLIEI